MKISKKDKLIDIFLLIFILICSLGVLMGAITSMKDREAMEIFNEAEFSSGEFFKTFTSSFITKMFFIFLVFLGGLNIFLSPIIPVSIYLKGYSYGFTSGCITSLSGFSGLLKVVSLIFLQNFIFCAFLSLYSSFALGKSISVYLNRRNYDFVKSKNKSFITATFIILIISLMLSLAEALFLSEFKIYTL